MATATVTDAYHGTLVAGTVDTITLPAAARTVEVVNRNGAAEIYFTVDGGTPTVAGNDTQVVTAGAGAALEYPSEDNTTTVVRLISSGTPTYSVRVVHR
jgi:hypothetical protein